MLLIACQWFWRKDNRKRKRGWPTFLKLLVTRHEPSLTHQISYWWFSLKGCVGVYLFFKEHNFTIPIRPLLGKIIHRLVQLRGDFLSKHPGKRSLISLHYAPLAQGRMLSSKVQLPVVREGWLPDRGPVIQVSAHRHVIPMTSWIWSGPFSIMFRK